MAIKRRSNPYDLNDVADQRLRAKFRRGYTPLGKRGKPYDLNHAAEVRKYFQWREGKF